MAAGTAPEASPGRRRSLAGTVVRGCAFGLFLCVLGEIVNHLLLGNIHVVIPGAVYRCAQPSAAELERLVRAYGIRTVINLRGFGNSQPWYREECRSANHLNLSLEDIGLSAGHLPPVNELKHLIEILDRSEYPIVFHCFRGVDRTGLACAIALLLRTDSPLSKARQALSLRFLHLPWGRTGSLDLFFDLYQEWLDRQGRSHSPALFRSWVLHEYRGGACSCRLELLSPVRVGPRGETLAQENLSSRVLAFPGEPPPRRLRVPRGRPFSLRVRCHNTSIRTWRLSPGSNAGIHVGWMLKTDQDQYVSEGRGGRFHAEVVPGSSIDLTMVVPSLWLPGHYTLVLDMIEEQHCFFRETGSEPLEVEVDVR